MAVPTDAGAAHEVIGLTDEQLDRLVGHAHRAEDEGCIEDARRILATVIDALNATGHQPLPLLRWMARLEAALGNYDRAARCLEIGRNIAAEAGNTTSVFQLDLARARLAIAKPDLAEAERVLTELPHLIGPPPPLTASAETVITWTAALQFTGNAKATPLRVEAALTIMDFWRAAGRYRSALALLRAARRSVAAEIAGARIAHTDLPEAELLFEAGELEDAWQHAQEIKRHMKAGDKVRHAIVSLRIALRRGRLADALDAAGPLERPATKDPVLLGQAAAARAALFNELNRYGDAKAEAEAASAMLAVEAPASPVRALLDRVAAATAFRERTSLTSWQLPWVPEQAFRVPGELDEGGVDAAQITKRRKHDEWIPLLDGILLALETGDRSAARSRRDRLIEVTHDVESRYVAARVSVGCALVDYREGGPTAAVLGRVHVAIGELKAIGARLAELAAVRFAAWLAGHLDRSDDHRTLAKRALDITDEIASELPPKDRRQFLLNKWSARDEAAMTLVDEGLRAAPRRGLGRSRALAGLFRQVDHLTSWSVDDALGANRAIGLRREDTKDQVVHWMAEHRNMTPPAGFALRSPWSLWGFPLRTVALHYHVLPDRIILFRFAWPTIDAFVLPVSRAELDRVIAPCLENLQNDVNEHSVDESLEWLAEVLGVTQAIAVFPRPRRLIVIAHDVLANVPFAALPVDGAPLCKRVTISHMDRLSRLTRRGPRSIDHFIGLAISRYQPPLTKLPYAEPEVEAIAALAGDRGATELGTAATRQALLDALVSATHVHVAAHGEFDLSDPARSGLLLQDGRLSLRDLRDLHASALRVVALSTCWSAEVATLPGRERICLPTALLDIGARSVVASLWEVGDRSGSELMCDLYKGMRKRGPAAALATAQAARAGLQPRCNWAGFLCYGAD